MSDGKITLDDPKRWGKHMRYTPKWQTFVKGYASEAYQENYGKIDWKVKRADDPFAPHVVQPNIGGEP